MSELENSFAEIVRRVVREELQCLLADKSEDLMTAVQVAERLNVNKQKVYSLVREGELEAVMISQREMRFTPSAIREFQLKRGVKAA